MRLSFALAATGEEPETVIDSFFEEEHYASLQQEDELFAKNPDEKQLDYIRSLVGFCAQKRQELDAYIEKYSHGWKPERITRTAAAVLRCALAEILYMDDAPASAAINEAIELAKRYDEPETVSFINGVLGGFMRGEMGAEPLAIRQETAQDELVEQDAVIETEVEVAEVTEAEVEEVAEPIVEVETEPEVEAEIEH